LSAEQQRRRESDAAVFALLSDEPVDGLHETLNASRHSASDATERLTQVAEQAPDRAGATR
jgi:hypothetical protein